MSSNSVELWKSWKSEGQMRMVIRGTKAKKKTFLVSSVAEAKSKASNFLETTDFEFTTIDSGIFDEPEEDHIDLNMNLDKQHKVWHSDDRSDAEEEDHGLTPPRLDFTSPMAGQKRKLPDWIKENLDQIDENATYLTPNNNQVNIDLTGEDSDENENLPDIAGDFLNDSWDSDSDNSSSVCLSQPLPTTTDDIFFKSVSHPRFNLSSSQPSMSSSQPPMSSSQPSNPELEYEIQNARMKEQELHGSTGRIDHDQLTREQKEVARDILSGRNVFITGPAGTGKSFLFQYIFQELALLHGEKAVAVTAPTGVAAVNVDGVTIHSFAGIGLGRGDEEELFKKVFNSTKGLRNWTKTKVLMIDEISMLGSELFTKLANIGARIRALKGGPSLPFGGIQLVLCGDFFQLPPVKLGSKLVGSFAFTSPAWKQLNVKMYKLTHIIRQKDMKFINILNTLRLGNVNQFIINILQTCHVANKALPQDGIIPTKLSCINKDVDAENKQRLEELSGKETVLEARDKLVNSFAQLSKEAVLERLKDDIEKRVPGKLMLKPGAQVVLVRNADVLRKLVNGTRGVVVGFKVDHIEPNRETGETVSGTFLCPEIRWDCGLTEALHPRQFHYRSPSLGVILREQFPLKLAWSMTVHKSQGMTLSRAEIRVSNAFDYGQVYVALSRCVSLDGLWMTGSSLSNRAVKAHPKVKEFYNL